MAQPECPYQSQFLTGFLPEMQRYDTDVLIFSNFLRGGTSDDYQLGEANIYNLINFEELDGLVIVPDSIKLTRVADEIKQRIRSRFKGPVVSVDEYNEDFINVSGSSTMDFEFLTDHIINKHGCRDIAFMTGPENHQHSIKRLEGFLNSMKKHGLSVLDSHIFYGDFWYYMGDNFVERLLRTDKKLPQAIMCACDQMAISIRKALEERNIRVPEDVIVTGYDCEGEGITHPHYVTSIPLFSSTVGVNAAREIIGAITGVELSLTVKKPNEEDLVFNTCGCSENKPVLPMQRFYSAYDESLNFDSGFNFMLELTITSKDVVDCLWNIDWFTHYIGDFEDFAICLCEDWENESDPSDVFFRREGYSENMIYALRKQKEEHSVDINRRFPVSRLLPVLDEPREKSVTYFFTPLHFNGRCFGYTALSLGAAARAYNISYSRWMRNVSCALESVRREANIKRLYDVISENETIAGYYDMFSSERFDEYCDKVVSEAQSSGSRMLVISAEILGYDRIRRNKDHLVTRSVVRAAATALDHAISGKSALFRMSPEEFVCIGTTIGKCGELDKLLETARSEFAENIEMLPSVGESALKLRYIIIPPDKGLDYMQLYNMLNRKKHRRTSFLGG